jgi:hypothetical protein
MENFEFNGVWWLPENPDKKVSGTLKFSSDETTVLQLIGSFKEITEINVVKNHNLILGLTSEGKEITLFKCYEYQSVIHIPGFMNSCFFISVVFVGHQFKKIEDIVFDSILLNYNNLNEWAGINGFQLQPNKNNEDDHPLAEIRYFKPQIVAVKLEKFSISIDFQFTQKGGFSEIKWEQTTFFKIDTDEPTNFDGYMSLCYNIQNFLSLAMGSAALPLTVIAKTKECQITMGDGNVMYPEIFIFYPIRGFNELKKNITYFNMLFSFRDISADYEKCIKNWFAKSSALKPVNDLYFGTLYNSSIYLQHAFSSLIQAIETYHRRTHDGKYLTDEEYLKVVYPILIKSLPSTIDENFRESLKGKLLYLNEFSLRKRLKEILEYCGNLTEHFIKNKSEFIENTVDTRNYLTHFDKKLEGKAKQEEKLNLLTQQLKFVLEICLLQELEISDTTIGNLIARKYH